MKAGSPGVGQHITPPKYNVKSTTTYITGWLVPGKGSPVLAELVPELVVDVLAQPVHVPGGQFGGQLQELVRQNQATDTCVKAKNKRRKCTKREAITMGTNPM